MKRTRVTERFSVVVKAPQGRDTRLARAVSGVLMASGMLAGAPAVAQQVEMEGKRPLEEIIVTARYRDERLQEIPIAITAINAEELEMRAFTLASDVAYSVPNASFRPAQAAFGNTMTAFIRGIGQYDFDFAFEPGVAIYIDDMYHPFTLGSQTQLMDLDHVEVLRGPQGTLFGRGSIGGAIRYVSKKPQGDDTGSIGLTVGEFDRVDVRASYDFAITDSRRRARHGRVDEPRRLPGRPRLHLRAPGTVRRPAAATRQQGNGLQGRYPGRLRLHRRPRHAALGSQR